MGDDGRIHANWIGAVMAEEESNVWNRINGAWDKVPGEEVPMGDGRKE